MADPNSSVWYDIATAVFNQIGTLGLVYGTTPTALPAASIELLKVPLELNQVESFPRVWVVLGGKEIHDFGDFEGRRRKYPVLIITLFASNQARGLNVDPMAWQQKFIDLLEDFQTTLEPNVTSAEIVTVEITPDYQVDPTLFKQANVDASALLAVFETERARTR